MQSLINEIRSIDADLRRIALDGKRMRARKKAVEKQLSEAMKLYKITEYEGFKLAKVDPALAPKRKKESEKREAAMEILKDAGVENPDMMWKKLKTVGKSTLPVDDVEEYLVKEKKKTKSTTIASMIEFPRKK